MYSEGLKMADSELPKGPFEGVPFLLKDLLADYKGFPMANGSMAYKKFNFISDCLIVTRVVRTTTVGPGQGFRLRTKTYLKPGYKIVKETLEISWDTSPWLDENSNWS